MLLGFFLLPGSAGQRPNCSCSDQWARLDSLPWLTRLMLKNELTGTKKGGHLDSVPYLYTTTSGIIILDSIAVSLSQDLGWCDSNSVP